MEQINDILKARASDLNSVVQMVKISAQCVDKEIDAFVKANTDDMKPDVLAAKVKVLRHDATEEQRAAYEEGAALLAQVDADRDRCTREAILRGSAVMPVTKSPAGITVGDKSIVEAVRANTEELQRSRLQREIRDASDDELLGRFLPEVARSQNLGVSGILLEEGNRRGGVLGSKVRTGVSAIPLLEYDTAVEILEVVDEMAFSLESAWHRLRTGEDDVHQQAIDAGQRYLEHEAEKAG